jgi:hypothetical protein
VDYNNVFWNAHASGPLINTTLWAKTDKTLLSSTSKSGNGKAFGYNPFSYFWNGIFIGAL